MSYVLINVDELTEVIAKSISPLQAEITRLSTLIKSDDKPLSISQFAKKSGRCEGTIRNMINAGHINYNQAKSGCKITIPSSELFKINKHEGPKI